MSGQIQRLCAGKKGNGKKGGLYHVYKNGIAVYTKKDGVLSGQWGDSGQNGFITKALKEENDCEDTGM